MSEDERLAWARLVSGRAGESHRLWCRYYDDRASLTDDERADGSLQCGLVRVLWRGTAHVALAAIGCLGDTFEADTPVAAIDSLGLVMCHVAALAEISELTMPAVIDLALVIYGSGEVPVTSWANLARSLGRGGVDFSASVRSKANNCARFDALAGVVARAIDDVHISYGVEVEPLQLYRRIADEVVAGRMPVQPERDPMELRYSLERQPEPAPRQELDRRTLALSQLREAIGSAEGVISDDQIQAIQLHIDAKERELWEHGYGGQAPGGAMTGLSEFVPDTGERAALERAGVTLVAGHAAQDDTQARLRTAAARDRDHRRWVERTCPRLIVLRHEDNTGADCRNHGETLWDDLESHDCCGECNETAERMRWWPSVSAWRTKRDERLAARRPGSSETAVPGLAEQRICPQCAGLLSERGDGMLACPNLHEFTAVQLQAIAAASTAAEPTG